ncbi:MAG TPA: hypothetical protein VD978_03835 [Azospirillum sp.]|nr:hypothetical protein [Azospirillum sp.]
MIPGQIVTQILIALSIAAPGVLSYRSMRESEHSRLLAAGAGVLFSSLWAGVVDLILTATPDTSIPGALWAALATAVVVTEAFFAGARDADAG